MGCKSSKEIIPIEDNSVEVTHETLALRRKSHCSVQSTNLTAEDSSILSNRGKRKNSLTSNPDLLGRRKNSLTSSDVFGTNVHEDRERLNTIERHYSTPNDNSFVTYIRVKKYFNPFSMEDLLDRQFNIHHGICDDVTEVAIQPDSWYTKPRPKLFIDTDR